ncbi:hypothetical protein SLE2022_289540 [Rubroshorea leprosula]
MDRSKGSEVGMAIWWLMIGARKNGSSLGKGDRRGRIVEEGKFDGCREKDFLKKRMEVVSEVVSRDGDRREEESGR